MPARKRSTRRTDQASPASRDTGDTPRFTEVEVARHWDSNADTWADHVARGWDLYRECLNNPAILKLIGKQAGKDVLDAGCGEGHNTRILARGGARMTGVDISPRMIELARETEKREPLGIRYEVTSFADLSMFATASFDTVVSFMAMMDGPNYSEAVAEVYRVLKPGGDFFFSITHPCFVTPGMDWVRDGQGNPIKLVQSGYFSKEHFEDRWRFSGAPRTDDITLFSVPRFPMTLSEYINPLASSGFVIRSLSEPRPSERVCREYPQFRRWRDVGAIFLHIHVTKPSA